ncbi:two-partner secretion domain-containing protein [Roseateles depolymerans]|uniref:Hemagglutinin-related protein n=1 Tax=Roseateles depolymerans TaxID=76731 RepID=A0A0U3LCF2_9BURK|nr:hemagglutinin repeat-containing protein [Roseateles depolymerans]ALV05759.1 Hemagglutinin-related protein [Roseateles depolymerans]REG12969.1 filamentous hemagglutinin [Roseateles depolymerans]
MNRLQYRIVFNKQRGQLMAVAETALSHVKGGSNGESTGPTAPALTSAETVPATSRGPPTLLALAAALAMGAAVTLTPDVLAQVVADPNAPKNQQPTVVTTANGTTQVNIQTPSAAGVSRNTYSQFDVNAKGVILNNARTDASTQLGGYVQANPWLAKGSARVILNEVNSSAPSQLKGFVEVAGQRAEVIIANPAGIQVDGGGFINASAAVLTTGTPRFNTDGSIAGYGVQGGLIRIDGQGLDASQTDYTALLARAVEINAGLWAKDARIQTGTQVMSVDSNGVTAGETLAPTGERPRYALDSTALGGIYAQRITLVGTEAGLGVRQDGQVVGGQLTLRADGWLENTGTVYAQQADANGAPALTVQSNSGVRNAGWIASRGTAQVEAPQLKGDTGSVTAAGMASDGTLVAGAGSLSLSAQQSVSQSGQLLAAERLTVQAPSVELGGAQAQAGTLTLSGGSVAAREALLVATGAVEATASTALDLTRSQVQAASIAATAPTLTADGAQWSASGTLSLQSAGTLSTRAASLAGGKLSVTARDIDLRQAEWLQIGTEALSVRAGGTITADGGRIASNGASLTLAADAFSALGASVEHYGSGALGLEGRSLDFSGATLWSNGALWARGAQVTLSGADVQARALSLQADTLLSLQRATVRTPGVADLQGQRLDTRDARLVADSGVTAQVGSEWLHDRGELLSAAGGIRLTGQADIRQQAGTIAARDDVSLQARSLTQDQGAALSGQTVSLSLQGDFRQDATASLSAAGSANMQAQTVSAQGQLRAGGSLEVSARDAASLGGSVYGGQVSVSAGTDLGVNGLLAAQGAVTATAAQQLKAGTTATIAAGLGTDGRIDGQSALQMSAGTDLTVRGQLLAGATRLSGATVDLAGAQVQTSQTLAVSTPGTFTTEGARLSAGAMTLQAQDWHHAGGQLALSGSGDWSVALTGQLDNRQGIIQSNAAALSLSARALDNSGGKIVGGGQSLTLQAATLDNQGGTVASAGDLTVHADQLRNRDGELSGRQIALTSGLLDNTGSGLIRASGAATVDADTLTHTGLIAAGQSLTVRTGDLTSSGTLAAGLGTDNTVGTTGDLTLRSSRTLTHTGTALAGGLARIDGAQVQLQGSQTQASDVSVTARSGDLRLEGATMVATNALDLTAASQLVSNQARLSGGSVTVSAGDWRHVGGELSQTDTAGRLTATVSGSLDNSSGRIAGNGAVMSLSAQQFSNVAGQVIQAGGTSGELRIQAETLSGAGGTLAGAGGVTLQVTGLADLSGTQALTQGDRISITAGRLSTRDATLNAQRSVHLAVSGEIDNTGGLQQSGGAWVASAGSLINRDGQIGGTDVALTGGSVDNGGEGLVLAKQRLSMDVAQLTNAGTLQSGGDVDLRASGRLDNSGLIRASGNALVRADTLTHTGTLAAQQSVHVDAGSVDSSGAIAAGLKDNNTVGATGDLTVTTTGLLRQSGTTLAGGAMTLSGGTLALQGGKFQAQQVALNASTGDLRLDGAALAGGEQLRLTSAGLLDTSSATLSAGSISVTAADWRNTAGDLAQTSANGQLTVAVTGTLDNQRGAIAGNAADVTVAAQVLDNRAGAIVHAGDANGTLAITVARLDGAGGQILGKGALTLQADEAVTLDGALTQARRIDLSAGSLSHRGGQLVSETTLHLTASGAVDNTQGLLQSAQDLQVDAGALDNSGGQISGRGVTLSVTDALTNGAQGLVTASQALTIGAGRITNAGALQSQAEMAVTAQRTFSNTGTTYARGPLTVSVGDALSNAGLMASQGALSLTAGQLSSSGSLAAGLNADNTLGTQGDLSVRISGTLQQSGLTMAAGAMSLNGATVQLQDAKLQAQSVDLNATAGKLQLTHAQVASSGGLTLTSTGALDSSQASVSGDQITIRAQSWSNVDGTVTQTGTAGAFSATLQGPLDNTRGEIAAAGRTLSISSGAMTNTQGRVVHAGADGMRIDASSLSGVGGQILGAQAVTLNVTGAADLSQAKTQGSQITLDAGSLRHQGGQLLSTGDAHLNVSGALDNTGGALVAAGTLHAQSGSLDNTGGQIGARTVELAAGVLNNASSGLIAAQGQLTVDAQQMTNAGALQAGTDARLTVTGGLSNSGSVYAQGNAVLAVGQALDHTGAIGAQGSLTVDAGSLSGTGSLAAGLRPDNTLAAQGDLTVRTRDQLQAGGPIIAAGALTLSGRDLALQDSRVQAGSATLNATAGDLRLDRVVLASAGGLMLSTAGLLATDGAALSASSIGLTAANWRNVGGTLTQLGSTGSLTATVSGQIVNTDGRIQSSGALLQLQAQSVDNTRGVLMQAGSGPLTVSTGSFSGASGQVLSNGTLALNATGAVLLTNAQTQGAGVSLTANSLDHRGGNLVSTGAAQVTVDGAFNNSGATLASAGPLELRAASVVNGGNGVVQSDSTLQMTVGGTLDNQGGRLRSGGAMTLNAGTVDNRGGWAATDGALTVTSGGALLNAGGNLLAQRDLSLTAASIGNQGGVISSLQGPLTARSQGALDNTQGVIQAAQTVDLQSTSLTNRLGEVSGAAVRIDTRGQTLDNSGGRLMASQSLTVDSGTLENRGGLLQSGGDLSIETHGAALNNTRDAAIGTPTGVVAGGTLTVNAGALVNETGLHADGSAQISVSQLTNRAELSAAALGLTVGGTLDNQGGRLIGGQSLTASAQQVLNQHGLIYGGNTLSLSAAGRIDNTGNAGSSQGIQGGHVSLQAQQLDNLGGQVLASGNLALTISQSLNNSGGALGASGVQTIGDGTQASALSLNNAGGRIWSGDAMGLNLRELAGGVGGQIRSAAGLSVKLAGDFSYGAGSQFQSAGDMTLNVAGNFSNQGVLRSGGALSIAASNIDNAASGELSGTLTILSAAGQLTNRGLIDGDGVMLTADRLVNIGTGRIYGGDIVIDGGQLVNGAEGGASAVIAGRRSIDAAMTRDLSNTGGALIFADGVLTMSGASLLNENSIIEASSGLGLNMTGALVNRTVLSGITTGNVGTSGGGTGGGGGGGGGGPGGGIDQPINQQQRMMAMRTIEMDQPVPDGTGGGTAGDTTTFLTPQAFIRSGGAMSLKGASLLNSGANIEARGDLLLQASTIDNVNPYLAWTTNSTGPSATVTQSLAANIIVGGQLTVVGASSITNDMSRVVGYTGVAISGGQVNNVAHLVDVVDSQGVTRKVALTLPSQAQSFIPGPQDVEDRQQAGGVSAGSGASQQAAAGGGRATAGGGRGLGGFFSRALAMVNGGQAAQANGKPMAVVRSGGVLVAQAVDAGAASGGAGGAQVEVRNASNMMVRAIGDVQSGSADGQVQGETRTGRLSVAQALRAAAAAQADGSSAAAGKAVTQAGKVLASSASASQKPGAAQGVTLRGSGATFNGKPLALSVRVNLTPPSNSLFKTHKEPTSKYLIETDPRFANYREWLSSDYLLQALALDPTVTQKRLGDGFYEQRLVREQIGQLTGSGYLSGYADDEAQYRALLNNGATFAKEHQLVPGVALTAEQMSQLTSDLVWLVEQTVTLADGSTQRVLVPQVYLVPREGDLTPSGSLIAGGRVEMALSGDFNNGGSVRGGDVSISAQNVSNTGEMRGTTLALSAREDLRNIGGSLAATGDMSLAAGRDIVMETTTASGGMKVGNVTTKATVLDQVASLSAGGVMVMQAGRDVSLEAVKITQGGADGAGANGGVLISAGRDLTLSTVQTSSSRDEIKNANNYKKESVSQDNGTSIAAQGAISLKAGQDLVATAAEIKSTSGAVSLSAGRDVELLAGEANQVIEQMTQKKKSGFLKKKVTTTYSKTDETVAVATTVSGNTVSVQANQDLLISGSNVVSDAGTTLLAGRDVTIDSVTNTLTSQNFSKTVKSGLMSGGGLGFTIGKQSLEQTNKKTELTSAGSTVASVQGDVTVVAGGAYKQVGSTVSAPAGDVSVLAKSIDIEEARNKSVQNSETKFKQSGLTVSISAPGVAAAMGAVSAAEHATQTEDDRMKALAAATAISKAMQAQKEISGFYDAIKADDAKKSISVSISVGSSKSTSQQTNQADQAAGSSVLAGGALSLVAAGADKDSNVTVRGSSLAGQDVTIKADNAINLVAAANNSEQHSNNKSTSSSVGVGFSLGQKREFGVTVSGSVSTGNSDGLNTSFTTTDVKGGNSVTLESGGNTALKGAVVTAPQVTAKVGGDLKVESLQDTATFDSKSTSVSGSVTFTGPAVTGANASFSNSKVSADYAAVGTQAGIRAGDGGFNVVVAGNTDLKGGAITSSQAAIDAGKNSLTTGTLTSSDINNRSQYSASAVTVSVGTSGGMAGGFKDSGDERSTTKSTISAGATTITSGDASSQAALDKLDRGATNDATAGKLAQGWDGQKLGEQAKLNAQIVADFGAEAAKQVAAFAKEKLSEAAKLEARSIALKDTPEGDALAAEAAKLRSQWDVDGSLRIAAHAVVGGLTGNIEGALGAAAGTALAPKLGDALTAAGVDGDLAQNLVALTSALVGSAVGGANGGVAALNEAENNYRSTSPYRDVRNAVTKASVQLYAACGADCSEERYRQIDIQLAKVESAATLVHLAVAGKALTTKETKELAQFLTELLPVFGTAESLRQAITGKASLSGEESDQLLATVGALPVFGAVFRRVPTTVAGKVSAAVDDAKAFLFAGDTARAAAKLAEAAKLSGSTVDVATVTKRLDELTEAADVRKITVVQPGSKYDWGKVLNGELEKESAYLLTNGHAYITDVSGRVKEVVGDLNLNKLDRNGYVQCTVGKCGNAGDEGGHLIATVLGGAGDGINIVPQDRVLNRGPWRDMERKLVEELQSGKSVSVKIEVSYPADGIRPQEFKVTALIGDGTTNIERNFTFTQ